MADVLEIPARITGGYQSGPSFNIWHVFAPPLLSESQRQDAVQAIGTFYTGIRSILGQGVVVDIAPEGVKDLSVTPPIFLGVTSLAVTSQGQGVSAPQLALCLSLKTGVAGRSYRGRKFLGPLTPESMAAGMATTDVANQVLTAANALRTALADNDTALQVYSEKLNTETDVTAFACNRIVDTLRSRAF